MTTPLSAPNILIESRYWVLNARLDESLKTREQLAAIAGQFKGQKMSGSDFVLENARHPLDNYTEETTVLRIMLNPGLTAKLNQEFCSRWQGLTLGQVSFYLTDLEILCSYAVFSVDPAVNIKTLEEEAMGLVDLVSSLQPDLESLIRHLENNAVVHCQPGLLFGVPEMLRAAGLHTPDNSYLYNWHVFFPADREALERTVAQYERENDSFPFDGGRVYPGWGLVLWDTGDTPASAEDLVGKIFIDSLSGSESVMYDNSIYTFTGYLDLIIREARVDSNRVRQVCNISHLALQRIKLWKRNLSVEQQVYHEKQRAVMMLEQKKADFDSSEETLIKAVEGLEVKQSQKSGRIIELVLSFFTALSLYSVANDFYSIMITDGSVKPINLFSARTILIFLATGIVLGFFYLLRKARKN